MLIDSGVLVSSEQHTLGPCKHSPNFSQMTLPLCYRMQNEKRKTSFSMHGVMSVSLVVVVFFQSDLDVKSARATLCPQLKVHMNVDLFVTKR